MSRRTLASLAALGLSLTLTACGGDAGVVGSPAGGSSSGGASTGAVPAEGNPFEGKTATEIQQLIVDGMSSVESTRVTADIINDGDAQGMDFALDRDGNCDGTMTLGGASADIKSDGTWSYMKGDKAFWTQITGTAQGAEMAMSVLGGKWVRSSATEFNEFCDLDELISEFDVDGSAGEIKVGSITQVDGVESVELTGTDTGDGVGDAETTTMWVTAAAPHRIVRMKVDGGDEPGEFAFSDYNEPVNVQVPADGEWVDQDSLGG